MAVRIPPMMNPEMPVPTATPTGCRRTIDCRGTGPVGSSMGRGCSPTNTPGVLGNRCSSAMGSLQTVGIIAMPVTVGSRSEPNLKASRGAGVSSGPLQEAVDNEEMSHPHRTPASGKTAARPGTTARVLVVEDSEAIREMVSEALTDAGYLTTIRPDGAGLEHVLEGFRPDLVVLDVMMPGRDGFQLIDVIRDWGQAGIVLLTARDGLPDRLRGLDGGADDYVVKPFELAELISRVGAVLRRRGRLPQVVQCGDLTLDLDAAVATRAGVPLDLTGTELRLLGFLVEQRGRIVSAGQILTSLWGYDAYDANLVHVHISSLRRKLEAHGPRILHTVRGIGYRLQPTRP
jgi:DNA-binding response OmpR family regulator